MALQSSRLHFAVGSVVLLLAATVFIPIVSAADPTARARVALDRTQGFSVQYETGISLSIWRRELLRQALLIAARSEMNLLTADGVIGETVSADDEFSLVINCRAGKPGRIWLEQGVPGKRSTIWDHEYTMPGDPFFQREWVERLEALSRKEFVEALEKAGFVRREKRRSQQYAQPLDPELAKLIDEDLTIEGQFLALRQLHSLISSDGETRARLGGLVRAYAHLGLLTEHQWHPLSYAFKARALLYAHRWTAVDPKSALALYHRGYAFALIGMHNDALVDIQNAGPLPQLAPAEMPEWLVLLDAYCKYDFDRLGQLVSKEDSKPIAAMLRYLAQEQEGSNNLAVKVGIETLEQLPGCDRILDTLCNFTGPGIGHLTTQAGQMHMSATLLPRLAKIPSLPAQAREALDKARKAGAILNEAPDEEDLLAEIEHRAKVIAALRAVPATPDPVEPGWPVLAQIVDETNFVQVYRRATFVRHQIGLPVDDELDVFLPLVENHRLYPFLELHRSDADPGNLQTSIEKFDFNDIDFVQTRLWAAWPDKAREKAFISALQNRDFLVNEFSLNDRAYGTNVNRSSPRSMGNVSPHSPYMIAMSLIASPNLDRVPDQWTEAAKRSPHLAQVFAETWKRLKDTAKTEHYLKLAAELNPAYETYRQLADHYKELHDDENWLKASEELLKTPELGLEHAKVRVEIAEYYVNLREWEKALPYANAAGQTGAQWALLMFRGVNEANQNWEAAEQGYVATIQRYREPPLAWYLFCQRNGCGQLEIAREAAFPEGVETLGTRPDVPFNFFALVLAMEGQQGRALEVLEAEAKTRPASWIAMRTALMADIVGDVKRRDTYLKQAAEQPPQPETANDNRPHREELVFLAKALIADLADGGKGQLDLDKLHEVRDQAPERDRCSFNYFLGSYFDQRGKTDQAIAHWKECMGASELGMTTRSAAGFELVKHGVKASEWKQFLFAKPAK